MQKLLVIDDDPGLAKLLAEYLGGRGYAVDTAGGGQLGLDHLRAGGVDLVILDLMMPEVDGFAVLREIRKQGGTPGHHAHRPGRRHGPHLGPGAGCG